MKRICFLGVFFSFLFDAYSQDPVFLNTNQSLIYLNPSFAGSNGGIRNQLSYRNQWPGLSSKYITTLNNFDAYIKPLKAGIAISYLHDDIGSGILKTNVISVSYAQHFNFLKDKLKIIPSVQLSYGQKNLDVNSLTFSNPITPSIISQWNSDGYPIAQRNYFNMGAGLLINYKQDLYVGAYIFNVNQPDVGLMGVSKLPYRLSLNASYNIHISEQAHLQFFYRYQQQQSYSMNQLSANMLFADHFITGLGYSGNYTPSISFGYRSKYFTVQLGYDATFSKLAGNTSHAWEMHASFNLRDNTQRKMHTNFENW
jgi:type IX secretion system PorP/SprF family membrane protein